MNSQLFSPLTLRNLKFKNRIFMPPMCQYSAFASDGMPTDWHLIHYTSRAIGGAGLIVQEATAVTPLGRISKQDLGLWNDEQMHAFKKITKSIMQHGSIPGIQLAHAGRKAQVDEVPLAPSALSFSSDYLVPREMTPNDIEQAITQFEDAAKRAIAAGYLVAEIHMAHGYLLHEFLSPLTNKRADKFGGELINRMRFPLKVAERVRKIWPEHLPVFVRLSATDWVEGGWDLPQTITLCHELKKLGIDLIDCSTGGNVPDAKIPVAPAFQVPFASAIKNEVKIATAAVGLITEAKQAQSYLEEGKTDAIFIGRMLLADPYWPLHAAKSLNVELEWPKQYERAKKV